MDWIGLQAQEVTLPEGILRVEVSGAEVDGSGLVIPYLNDEQISRERAAELVERHRRRMTGEQK